MTHTPTRTDASIVIPFAEDAPRIPAAHDADALLLNLEGFEGPIDVLLELARNQKVDLAKISILQLVRQYLSFVDRARELQLELAADYLVMAAWLAYLKSRLLLPRAPSDAAEASADEMAEALSFQLRRYEAMQKAALDLFARPRRGQGVFARGRAEPPERRVTTVWSVTLYDLLAAYGDIKARAENSTYHLPNFRLMSMDDALDRMGRMLGRLPRGDAGSVWATLTSFMPNDQADRLFSRSALASLLTASLEMVKQGRIDIRQDALFAPVYVRERPAPAVASTPSMPDPERGVS